MSTLKIDLLVETFIPTEEIKVLEHYQSLRYCNLTIICQIILLRCKFLLKYFNNVFDTRICFEIKTSIF